MIEKWKDNVLKNRKKLSFSEIVHLQSIRKKNSNFFSEILKFREYWDGRNMEVWNSWKTENMAAENTERKETEMAESPEKRSRFFLFAL